VLDWERVALAGPAQDLALGRHLGPAFTGIMVEAYARANGPYTEKSGTGRIGTGNCASRPACRSLPRRATTKSSPNAWPS
jgi:hypothetical protein